LLLLGSGNKKQGYVFVSLACAICALALGVGVLRMKGSEEFLEARIKDDPVKVAMVQGNIDQLQKWDAIFRHRTIETYIKLSERIDWDIPSGGALLIWPETAMPFFYQNSSDREIIKLFAAGQNVPLLFGAPGYAFSPYGERIFNRAYLLEPGVPGPDVFYEKEHLVPFGEYVPSWLDFPVLSGLLQEIGNFAPGEKVAPLRMQSWPDVEGDSQRARLALGVLICYETIFPDLVRQRVADGANLLVNISNDAWFGDTSGPEQHLRMAALRAVEMSRYVARGANTGISAVIDPLGRILERGDLNREQVVSGTVAGVPDLTVYFHIAPFMWPVAVISLIVWLVWVLMLRKQNRSV
jgi:apolipoprotein N-acyltransferase